MAVKVEHPHASITFLTDRLRKVFSAYIEKIILQSETFANNVVTRLLIVVQNNIVIRFEHSVGLDALALCILIYKSTDIGIVLTGSKVSCAIFLRRVAYVRLVKMVVPFQ